eukprot:CAMPEP_0115161048 /NCGR_PEP_ID=MMETSP0227-20121206/71135_1 /TAXON_ID=89957 /ORGANISM="Polarella glacialis, Strain CCMP 1383" /LENGTH=308 /DNA_ID=CAMNT_0002572995 /DNA_START=95 /DNA_END=1021 /DNA_ORIENTATION=-
MVRRISRWADVDGSDDDDDSFEDEVFAVAPLAAEDSSYQEAPLTSLEDSKTGLNLLMARKVLENGPKDFTFLLRGQCISQDSEPAFKLNADAPEFIPTLSMSCPLIGVCELDSQAQPSAEPDANPVRSSLAKDSSGHEHCFEGFFSPEQSFAPSPFCREAQDHSARRRGCSRKRRPATLQLQAPSQKRTKSEERQVTEATEEVWEHRAEMRAKGVAMGKTSSEYQWSAQLIKKLDREDPEPLTPDYKDRAISKRQWKRELQSWRSALKQRYMNDACGSQVSTEDLDVGSHIESMTECQSRRSSADDMM